MCRWVNVQMDFSAFCAAVFYSSFNICPKKCQDLVHCYKGYFVPTPKMGGNIDRQGGEDCRWGSLLA